MQLWFKNHRAKVKRIKVAYSGGSGGHSDLEGQDDDLEEKYQVSNLSSDSFPRGEKYSDSYDSRSEGLHTPSMFKLYGDPDPRGDKCMTPNRTPCITSDL